MSPNPKTGTTKSAGFSAEEKAAMKARAKELKAAEDGETAVQEAIAEMAPHDRAIAKRLHAIIKESAPDLTPKTWYGMPAYAKDGKVVCFFRNATKFKERYAMLGFNDSANLDQGSHVAGRLRVEGADRRGGDEDPCAREESGEVVGSGAGAPRLVPAVTLSERGRRRLRGSTSPLI